MLLRSASHQGSQPVRSGLQSQISLGSGWFRKEQNQLVGKTIERKTQGQITQFKLSCSPLPEPGEECELFMSNMDVGVGGGIKTTARTT